MADLKRFTLTRDTFEPERTFGRLTAGAQWIAETLEPGDADVDHPRIPAGFYHCVRHGWEPGATVRFKRTWALVGSSVSHQVQLGVPRSTSLFHDGARDEHTHGCVLLGSVRGISRGEPGLLEKVEGEALDRLRAAANGHEFYLTILEGSR